MERRIYYEKIDRINKELKETSEKLMNKYNEINNIWKKEIEPLYFKLRELQDEQIKLLNKES